MIDCMKKLSLSEANVLLFGTVLLFKHLFKRKGKLEDR
ncbi:hypothetical protein M2140_002065 [Clostridiales Family XIII bacterium PM5-7]